MFFEKINRNSYKYAPIQPKEKPVSKSKIFSLVSAGIVILSMGAVALYFIITLNYRFDKIIPFLSTLIMSNTTDSIIYGFHLQRQQQKDIEIHYYPLGDLEVLPKSLRPTAINLLLEEANDLLDQETTHVSKNMRDAYPDMRELEFHLRYAHEVENGIRGPELEPEWEWAANISIVYTWINGSEPLHLQQKAKYNGGHAKPDSRDRCVDELRYSIRSLINNLIWHKGTIYIVSPTNHVPEWLDPSFDRIKIIDQSKLLPEKNVLGEDVNPTFNSFAIEWYLDKIEGISEQFIQINDDYFFRRPVHPSLFFYGGGEAYNLNPSLVKPLNHNEKIIRERKKFNNHRKGTKITDSGIWEFLYGNNKKREEKRNNDVPPQRVYRRSLLDYNNFIPMPDPMFHYAIDEEAIKEMENVENQNIPGRNEIKNKNDSIIVLDDINGQQFVLDLSNGVYSGLVNKEEYENKNWSSDFTSIEKNDSLESVNMKEVKKTSKFSDRIKNFFSKDEEEKVYSKTYYPNAARHFHFPIIYMENRRVDKNLNSYKRIGYKDTFKTSWSQKFEAAESITTFCLKSFFGQDIGINSLYHAPYVFYRDLYEPSRQLYREYLNLTLTHRFRDGFDILPPLSKLSYLRYQASSSNFEEEFDKQYNMTYIYAEDETEKNLNNDNNNEKHIRTILKYGFHIMSEEYVKKLFTFGAIYDNCRHNQNLFKEIVESETLLMYNLNDDYTYPEAGEQLREFLKFMYPEPGPFEKVLSSNSQNEN
ncbi:hypothetical protein BCR32DRAFT_249196 [Anaeromyces robustus]|jgi:hypothetical protein|uniref:Stealth protein CR2 conserved region 2 domain-containing protein n=1 Tax=Anaeromyces robustus TaxID=1754192 RepID=A0A1Y1WRF9_9FUNG|nr:hypothetical protein BCR32DRAFT_249196 [Anaeromyces robustus]|eukprot:ORX75868.1 hypothetical protein BCR32DRAFT_249196 [Anaeromyces robustus]